MLVQWFARPPKLVTAIVSGRELNTEVCRTLTQLCGMKFVDVLFFGDSIAIENEGKMFKCVKFVLVPRKVYGMPALKSLFEDAVKRSKSRYFLYLNEDILIPSTFEKHVNAISRTEADFNWDFFFATGSRRNIAVENLQNFTYSTKKWDEYVSRSAAFVTCAQDYFLVPRSFPWNLVPDLVIGAACWDNIMVDFMIRNQYPLVDTSQMIVLHQSKNGSFQSQRHVEAHKHNCKWYPESPFPNHECTKWSTIEKQGEVFVARKDELPAGACLVMSCGGEKSGIGNDFLTKKLYALSWSHPEAVGVAYVNRAYVSMALSFFCNYLAVGGKVDQILIIATDRDAFDALNDNRHGFAVAYVRIGQTDLTEAMEYGHYDYWWWLVRRVEHFQFLLGLKVSILHFEVDSVWIRNAFLDKEIFNDQSSEIIAGLDVQFKTRTDSIIAYGFVLYRPTSGAFHVHNNMVRDLQFLVDTKHANASKGIRLDIPGEQFFLQKHMKSYEGFRFAYMDPKKYVSGQWYDDSVCGDAADLRLTYGKNVWVIQNNWIVSKEKKISRYKRWGHWFIDENDECLEVADLQKSLRHIPTHEIKSNNQVSNILCDSDSFRAALVYAFANVSKPFVIQDSFTGFCEEKSDLGCHNFEQVCNCSVAEAVVSRNAKCDWKNSNCKEKTEILDLVKSKKLNSTWFFSGCCHKSLGSGCNHDIDCGAKGNCIFSRACGIYSRGVKRSNIDGEWIGAQSVWRETNL